MQDIQDNICCMWECTIFLEKCCVHMPCSLNDQNDVILQLLQVLLVCYGAIYKNWSNKPLLADCTLHGTFCRMEWHLHDSVDFQRPRTSFSLFTSPWSWKWALSLSHKQSKVVGYCCTNHKKSWQNSHFCCLLASVSIYMTWILLRYNVISHHTVVYVDVLLMLSDWEHHVRDFLRLWSSSSCAQATLSCMHADLCLPTTHFLSQTLPVNSNFCTRLLIADLAGASHLLNFLQNYVCIVTKPVAW